MSTDDVLRHLAVVGITDDDGSLGCPIDGEGDVRAGDEANLGTRCLDRRSVNLNIVDYPRDDRGRIRDVGRAADRHPFLGPRLRRTLQVHRNRRD